MMNSWIPRVPLEQMQFDLSQYLRPRVERLGYVGEWFQYAGNAPAVLLAFMRFTDALKDALAFDISETIVLTVASVRENRYERNQHERLSIRSGLQREWIEAVEMLDPESAALLTPAQRAVQRYALDALRGSRDEVQRSFEALQHHFSPSEAISAMLLIGRYWSHGLGVNTLDLAPPVPSIFEDGFTAEAKGTT